MVEFIIIDLFIILELSKIFDLVIVESLIEDSSTVENMQNELEAAGFEMLYTKSFSMDISTLLIARKK